MLVEGMSGPAVVKLQNALKQAGFNPGNADGSFGPGTEAALKNFQLSQGLLDDGKAGEITLEDLGAGPTEIAASVAPTIFPDITVAMVAKMFPNTHVRSITNNLPYVLASLQKYDIIQTRTVLAALATIRAECESWIPTREFVSRYNTSPHALHDFDLYDNRKDLGNRGAPDGANYRGSGFIQLTGLNNYTEEGHILGVDIVSNPELANTIDMAADLLAIYISRVYTAMKRALMKGDLAEARRLVNGGEYGLSEFSEAYTIGCKLFNMPLKDA
jgi:peptidoglycan L-alanyl-D-glutamate endopeptidase CwlK